MVSTGLIAQALAEGVVYGAVVGVAAMSLSLIFGMLDLFNFAHGDMLSFGAYIAFTFNVMLNLPIWVAFLLTLPVTAGFTLLVDRIVFKPLRDRDLITLLIASVGAAFIIRNVIRILWGVGTTSYDIGYMRPWNFGPVNIYPVMVGSFVVAAAMTLALHFLLTQTLLGKKIRAVSDNPRLAMASGIHKEQIIRWAWVLTGVSVGGAGVLIGLQQVVDPLIGFQLLLAMFAAIILGGIGNPYGALVGGVIVGIIQELSVTVMSPAYQIAATVVLFTLFFIFRPEGLFPQKATHHGI